MSTATAARARASWAWRQDQGRRNWPVGAHEQLPGVLDAAGPAEYADAAQAKDIPDDVVMAILEITTSIEPGEQYGPWLTRWDLGAILGANEKVVLAKARRMIGRGMFDGCACGCRGDFEPIRAGNDERPGP